MARILFVCLSVLAAGCIIGTWPTPEYCLENAGDPACGPGPVAPGRDPVGNEACDGFDDDADGSIDEGCACTGPNRGCVAVDGDRCGLGVQYCHAGFWRECDDAGPPFTPARPPSVELVSVTPAELVRGDSTPVVVVVRAQARCDAIQVKSVDVVLAAAVPLMRVRAVAHDRGELGDAEAFDGDYTAVLPNAFGPGVLAQPLMVEASTSIDNVAARDAQSVGLEDP